MSSDGFSIELNEVTVENLLIGLMGFFGVSSGFYALWIIKKCSYLTGIVEHYCLLDVFSVTVINACHLFWALPSNLWGFDESIPFFSTFFGTLAYSMVPLVMICKILLGINRYFSVAFRGLFYRYLEKYRKVQYFVLIGYPIIASLPLFIPDCQVTYLAQPIPFFVIFGECGIAYVNIVQLYFGYVEMVFSGVFDLGCFLLLRKRMKELSSQHMKQTGREERDVRMQFRLACQMLASMFGTILMNLATTLGQFYVQTNFHFFILFTFSWQALCCMNCLIYIIFQREKKRLPQGARSTITVHSEIHSHHRQTRKNQISNQK